MLRGVQEGIYFITGKDIRDESLPFPFYQPGDHVYIGNPRHGRHVLPKRTQDAGLPGCRGILYILAFHKAKDGVGIKAGGWLWEPGKVTVKAPLQNISLDKETVTLRRPDTVVENTSHLSAQEKAENVSTAVLQVSFEPADTTSIINQ